MLCLHPRQGSKPSGLGTHFIMNLKSTTRAPGNSAFKYCRESLYRAHVHPALVADQRGPYVGVVDVCSGPGDGRSKGIEAGHGCAQAVASHYHLHHHRPGSQSEVSKKPGIAISYAVRRQPRSYCPLMETYCPLMEDKCASQHPAAEFWPKSHNGGSSQCRIELRMAQDPCQQEQAPDRIGTSGQWCPKQLVGAHFRCINCPVL